MTIDSNEKNWRVSPSFNKIFDSLAACVIAVVDAFGRRQRTQFVILRHRINSTWAMMPWSQYRHLPSEHPANPCTICYFGTFHEFREMSLAFPPDLFAGLPPSNSPLADPDIPPFDEFNAEQDQADTTEKAEDSTEEKPPTSHTFSSDNGDKSKPEPFGPIKH